MGALKKTTPLKASSIGQLCKLVREREGLGQVAWGKKIGVTQGMVGQVEIDHSRYPISYVKRLKKYMTDDEFLIAWRLMSESLLNELMSD